LDTEGSNIKIYGWEEVTETWIPIEVNEDGELEVVT